MICLHAIQTYSTKEALHKSCSSGQYSVRSNFTTSCVLLVRVHPRNARGCTNAHTLTSDTSTSSPSSAFSGPSTVCVLNPLHGIVLEFFLVNRDVVTSPDTLGGLPYHDHVVFRDTGCCPVLAFARSPAEISRTCCVA
jgi:hypothetical protein